MKTILICLVAVLIYVGTMMAQTRALEGQVNDEKNVSLPQAIVYLKNLQTLDIQTCVAGEGGMYTFDALSQGVNYEIYAEFHGKRTDVKTLSSFDSRARARINLRINPQLRSSEAARKSDEAVGMANQAPEPTDANSPTSTELTEGQTPTEVERVLGKPVDITRLKENLVYTYPAVKVFFEHGKLVNVEPRESSQQHPDIQATDPYQAELVWTDPATGLMWKREDNGSWVDWYQAQIHCANIRVAGYSDWRLPTIDELAGIYDETQHVNGQHIKGGIKLSSGWVRSSTADGIGSNEAWGFHFANGERVSYRLGYGGQARALCVRRPGK